LDICLLHYDPTLRHFSAELHKRISGAHDKNNFEMMNDDAWPLNLSLDRFTLRQKYALPVSLPVCCYLLSLHPRADRILQEIE
jgi:hypothetical protein